ncbi:MAG TPA: LuxR C-terminal-related transcriptional regulator, partial [Ktedonobacteraceae bacterium]
LGESLTLHRALGNKRGVASVLLHMAETLFDSQGDQAIVCTMLEEGLVLFKELGDKDGIAASCLLWGQVALRQGDKIKACSLLEESIRLYREMGYRWGIAESLYFLARVAAFQDSDTTAQTIYEESLAIAREMNHKELVASCLEGLAGVVATQGTFVWAAQLWGAAETLREAVGAPIPPINYADYKRSVANVCTQLGEKVFAATWAWGRTMTPEQALAMQGREVEPPPTKAETTYPARLTTREVGVLRLVVKGLTNAEIAGELGLSEKTIAHHLTNIFNKTTSENRAAAAAFAIRNGLA